MTKSELIKVLKDSIKLYGDGKVVIPFLGETLEELNEYCDNPDNSITLL